MSATAGNRRAEFGHRGRPYQGVKPTDNPNAQKKEGTWEPLSDVPGSADDSRGDGVANSGGDPEPDAEHFEETAT